LNWNGHRQKGGTALSQHSRKSEIEGEILEMLTGEPLEVAGAAFKDPEINALQEYANVVSIRRLGMNDHGPVHMRIAARNALKMLNLLLQAGILPSLVTDSGLEADHSRTAVFLGAFLHDIGMTIGRDGHEDYSLMLARPLMERLLSSVMQGSNRRRIAITSAALEGIAGHMAKRKISSVEAGLVLVGDGCDMEHGRSRAPARLSPGPQVGDIHQYSAAAVERVDISEGEESPIQIAISLSENAGFFQVENVLFPKIASSPVKPYIELLAGIAGKEPLKYL
jgi:uncharacterized protein